ncbi:MAG: hypothetical protein NTW07_07370 [candidate division Zixibacteria bacterium]|nr:hypothetical protein [candidate division Zixibacteria bacterium]
MIISSICGIVAKRAHGGSMVGPAFGFRTRQVITGAVICFIGCHASLWAATVQDSVRSGTDGGYAKTSDQVIQLATQIAMGTDFNGLFRFQSLGIPSGATIDSAFIRICGTGSQSDSCYAKILAEDTGSATTFSTYSDWTARHQTTARVGWDLPEFVNLAFVTSPNIKIVIQEVVDRADWDSANNLALFLRDSLGNHVRYVNDMSYDGVAYSAKILIYYTAGSPPSGGSVLRGRWERLISD